MTAYELMCKRNISQNQIEYLEDTLKNDTETVLLTNAEVKDIINCLKEMETIIDIRLNKIKIE